MARTVLLIGAGNMGFAMLKGWLDGDDAPSLYVVDPLDANQSRATQLGAQAVGSITSLPKDIEVDLTVLAVKPQLVLSVLNDLTQIGISFGTLLSVAAGVTMASVASAAPDAPIIRCMPNTPAAIGQGMMVLVANSSVDDVDRAFATSLMQSSGKVAWIEDENLMDAVTAISGSGPAYVFHMVEALTASATALGLPEDVADLLAKQTVMGAGMMVASSEESPTQLRKNVTSPNGTTEAALNVLMAGDALENLMKSATLAARDRGVELGKA